ncbi:hypothetical protein [Streptomyces sp. MB09-02B]|uniref:hypothetical protein n=1 Tax=Streptomyces sp. MB09-02B TaxID=3028667 RepID=UPI0029B94754|nr:hypothetical protein [Streptomyces sp. MB09-02B]MDX3639986.1 hypothetical protein [Streptomyces sp. MB09-02B]
MEEAPDIVMAVEGPTVHIRRVRLGPRRQGLRQRASLIAEMPKASSGMAQAQPSQPEQRTTRHSPRPDLHAPVLDEPRVTVVQRGADQDSCRLALC